MSTMRTDEMKDNRRWLVPGLCVVAAIAYAAVFLAHHRPALAAAGAGVMLAYGAVLVVFSRRSEAVALLRDEGRDERRSMIMTKAAADTLYFLVVLALDHVVRAAHPWRGSWHLGSRVRRGRAGVHHLDHLGVAAILTPILPLAGASRAGTAQGPGPARTVSPGRYSNASGGGQEQTRLRSPYAWSMRRTGGQYLFSRSESSG